MAQRRRSTRRGGESQRLVLCTLSKLVGIVGLASVLLLLLQLRMAFLKDDSTTIAIAPELFPRKSSSSSSSSSSAQDSVRNLRPTLQDRALVEPDVAVAFAANQTSYCVNEGSLHQIALDMFQLSSPVGSASYNKFLHVLQQNPTFFTSIGKDNIFAEIENNVVAMLQGFGLKRLENWTSSATLVDVAPDVGLGRAVCDIGYRRCLNQTRLLVQSEQVVGSRWTARLLPAFRLCHQSANCVIVEYSSYNYKFLQDEGLSDSVVLLPIMTQETSRIGKPKVASLKPLWNRTMDMVFFGSKTDRRKPTLKAWNQYANETRSVNVDITRRSRDLADLARSYSNAKVCLILHAYMADAALEYHRLSEFGPFGCIPLVETSAETFAIEPYRRCGRAVFAEKENLFAALHVILDYINRSTDVEQGIRHAEWWSNGTRWAEVLPAVLGREATGAEPE